MAKVPAELRQSFHELIDEEENKKYFDNLARVMVVDEVALGQVLRVIKQAQQRKADAIHAAEKMRNERERYEKQRQGQRALAKAIPLLEASLPLDDPNYHLIEAVSNAIKSGSSASDCTGKLSPPREPIRFPKTGNPAMPWISEAREGLRQAGISDEETREELLLIFSLKRKQQNRE
jgi:hypothetical protein